MVNKVIDGLRDLEKQKHFDIVVHTQRYGRR